MTSYIKIGWARVFNAACEKEVAIDKWQDDQRTEWIDKHMSTLIGYLWWKRNPSKEEAEKAFIESDDAWIYDSIAEQRRTRAKKLQSMAITASTEYDTNMDQVYLTLDDNQFLFG